MSEPVRSDGNGGWLCEHGAAYLKDRPNHRKEPRLVCNLRATWIMVGYDPAKPMPGTVTCDAHVFGIGRPMEPLPRPVP